MTQLILIATLASLPPYINRRIVAYQMRQEAAKRRMIHRRELIRHMLNMHNEKDD